MPAETQSPIDYLRHLVRHTRVIIRSVTPVSNRELFELELVRNSQEHRVVVSGRFLDDLPETGEYQKSTKAYFEALENRMLNASPDDFYCVSGIPLQVFIDWPAEPVPGYAASAVKVRTHDLREKDKVAICAVKITYEQTELDLKRDPFLREQYVMNTLRKAIDRGDLEFRPRPEWGVQLPMLDLELESAPPSTDSVLEEFLLGKVYWLGFKRVERNTRVWIADPWDARYLGATVGQLIQTAQVLEAEKMIKLDSQQAFASTEDGLLLRARPSAPTASQKGMTNRPSQPDWNPRPRWDVFICHASEDKEEFVKPLAEALVQRGLGVWYDEFELKMGDSLRRSIDRGLHDSRFGIVVLSHAFFSKEWPQKELDGLAAREVDGTKVILPVWHRVSREEVLRYSPTLADKKAASTFAGLDAVVREILAVVRS